MTAAMTAAVAALRSLGLVDIVPVTALYGGGWTEAQLWTARTPSNLTVFAKTVANADLDTADTLGPARHQPASPTPHPAAATHELAAEIRVYRALPDSTWHPAHLDSVIADPANVDADDPDAVSVLVLEHLDPLTFKPALTRRAQPGTITVAALRALIETIAGDTDHLDVAALHWSTYTDRHPADTWTEWAHTPPAHPDTINAARFARAAPHWAAAAADLDITGTTVAHLDLHPANTAIRSDGTAVAIDLGPGPAIVASGEGASASAGAGGGTGPAPDTTRLSQRGAIVSPQTDPAKSLVLGGLRFGGGFRLFRDRPRGDTQKGAAVRQAAAVAVSSRSTASATRSRTMSLRRWPRSTASRSSLATSSGSIRTATTWRSMAVYGRAPTAASGGWSRRPSPVRSG